MISIYSAPKAFSESENVNRIQRNAILSWQHLPVEKEIILLGKEEGVKECAQEFGCRYSKDLDYNYKGNQASAFSLTTIF